MKAIRWSDDDRYFGPFTYASEQRYLRTGVSLGSGDGDDYPGCRLRLHAFGRTLIIALPPIIKPSKVWHEIMTEPTRSKVIAQGRAPGYFEYHAREYGFTVAEGSVHFKYGNQTHDSRTDKTKVWFLPWRGMRFVRHSFYDLDGHLFFDMPQRGRMAKMGEAAWHNHWTVEHAIRDACPVATFEFEDFDGERLTAATKIEEREWAHGEGWFKWLSLFRKNQVRRSLDIRFSGETGRRKGSWKGGAIGGGIDMLPGELHVGAFLRYCNEHDMTFVAQVIEAQRAETEGFGAKYESTVGAADVPQP